MDSLLARAKAREFATRIHRGQTRKFGPDKGKAYSDTHLSRVAGAAQKAYPDDPDVEILAWIHDTWEDQKHRMSLRHVFDTWGQRVHDGLIAISKGDDEDYLDYLIRVFKDKLALKVKRLDIADNMETAPPKIALKYRMALALFDAWERADELETELL